MAWNLGTVKLPRTGGGGSGAEGNPTGVKTGAANATSPPATADYLRLGVGAGAILIGVSKGGNWHVLTAGGVLLILWQGAKLFGINLDVGPGSDARKVMPSRSLESRLEGGAGDLAGLGANVACQYYTKGSGGELCGKAGEVAKYLGTGYTKAGVQLVKDTGHDLYVAGRGIVSGGRAVGNALFGDVSPEQKAFMDKELKKPGGGLLGRPTGFR